MRVLRAWAASIAQGRRGCRQAPPPQAAWRSPRRITLAGLFPALGRRASDAARRREVTVQYRLLRPEAHSGNRHASRVATGAHAARRAPPGRWGTWNRRSTERRGDLPSGRYSKPSAGSAAAEVTAHPMPQARSMSQSDRYHSWGWQSRPGTPARHCWRSGWTHQSTPGSCWCRPWRSSAGRS